MTTVMEVLPQNRIFTRFSQWHLDYVKNKPFQAIKWGGKFRPCDIGDKDVFVYGLGRKSIGTKAIQVPALSVETDLNEYLDNYGSDCLFYALTGREINSGDCCYTALNNEFTAAIHVGLNKWLVYIERVRALIETVNAIYLDKYGIEADNEAMQTTKQGKLLFRAGLFTVSVQHYISYPFRALPHFDPITDDDKLLKTYVSCELAGEWDLFETDTKFPGSVRDRLAYLFSEGVANEYKALMHYFGL